MKPYGTKKEDLPNILISNGSIKNIKKGRFKTHLKANYLRIFKKNNRRYNKHQIKKELSEYINTK